MNSLKTSRSNTQHLVAKKWLFLFLAKDIEICEPSQNFEASPANNLIQTQINKERIEKPSIFPNPAKERITINLSKDVNGSINYGFNR